MLTAIISPSLALGSEFKDELKTVSTAEYTDDFEIYKENIGTTVRGMDNWSISTNYAGKNVTIEADPADSTNTVVKYSTDPTVYTTVQGANTYAVREFNAVSGRYLLVSTSIYPTSSERWMFILYGNVSRNGTDVATGRAAIELMIESGGKLAYECRGKNPTWTDINTNTDNWAVNRWNDIDILIDTKGLTFDVYTNNVKRNAAPMALSGQITGAGDCLSAITGVNYGVTRYSTKGDLYIDNLEVNAISVQELVMTEYALTVPTALTTGTQLPAVTNRFGMAINWESNTDAVIIGSDGKVIVNANDSNVILTAKCGDVTIGTYPATAFSDSNINTLFFEPFNYTEGASLSQEAAAAKGWSIENEALVTPGTGSTALIKADPEDKSNLTLDIEALAKYNSGYNRYALISGNFSSGGSKYIMLSDRVRFTSSTNRFVFYVMGTMANAATGASTRSANLVQFSYDPANKQFAHEDYTKPNGTSTYTTIANIDLPLNKWIDMKFILDTEAQTYNIIMDGVKVNSEPLRIYRQFSGEKIATITQIRTGANRWDRTNGHMYLDDLKISAFDNEGAIELETECLTLPGEVDSSFTLPVTGGIFGTAYTWSSSSDTVSISGANATVKVPYSTEDVVLTLNAALGNATSTKDFVVKVLGDGDRINAITDKITVYTLSGQKYVTESFTPNIANLAEGDKVDYTVNDSALVYDAASNRFTVACDTEDKIVDLKVTVTSKNGNKSEKDLKVYILSEGIITFYEDMNYPALKGATISGADSWEVTNEEPNIELTGVTQYINPSPDDETDLTLNTNVIRGRDPSKYGNQYALWKGNAGVSGDATMQANIKFDNNAANQYIWYTTGTVTTSSGSSTQTLIQLFMNRNNGTLQAQTKPGVVTITSEPLPTNEWFNLKVKINAARNTFDVYLDNKKLNTEEVPFYSQIEGGVVTAFTQMQFGASRYMGNPGNLYVDDILVRSDATDALATEIEVLKVPETLIYDVELPTKGIYEDTNISWSSDKPEILSADGKVNRLEGFGSTEVKLTAALSIGSQSATKDFYVNVLNTPPYTVDALTFEKADGSAVYSPVSGGKISTLSVTRYTEKAVNAKAIVAVYADDETLLDVTSPIAVSESGTFDIGLALPERDDIYVCAYVWNMNNLAPLSYKYRTLSDSAEAVTIYTVGDSTMQSYGTLAQKQSDNTITGWAQVLGLGFDNNMVKVDNHGVSGMSTRSFYNLGYIHDVYHKIQPGDYFIIQFAHNDEKTASDQMPDVKYAPLEEEHRVAATPAVPQQYAHYKTYEQWLREYTSAIRMKGAHVVFATSIYRRQFNKTEVTEDNPDGMTPNNSHVGYPEAMADLAIDLNVPVLDLHTRTGEWLDANGYDGSLKYFLAYHGGTDNTHLTYDGAVEIANMAIDEMKKIGLPVAKYATEVPAR